MVRAVLDEVQCFLKPREGMLCFARDKRGTIRFRAIKDKFCFRNIKEMEQGDEFQFLTGEPITFLSGWGCHGFEESKFSKEDKWQARAINIKHSKTFPLVGEVI